MNETYENMQLILDKIKYNEFEWALCSDLKVVALVSGMQTGNTKFSCFLCEWDSRMPKNHYIQKVWPPRKRKISHIFNFIFIVCPSIRVICRHSFCYSVPAGSRASEERSISYKKLNSQRINTSWTYYIAFFARQIRSRQKFHEKVATHEHRSIRKVR